MAKYRIYIADMDEGFVARVRGVIANHAGIEVIGNSGNGKQALKDIVRLLPDVVLTDIPLPELDGIALLREVRRLRRAPEVIVCTRFYSDASMQCACRYGAAFFLCKPIELQTLPGLICECGRSVREAPILPPKADEEAEALRTRASIAREILKELGIPSRLDGSTYILETAIHCRKDDILFKNLSRGLYQMLADRMDTTVIRVERSIRSAVTVAYERGTLSRNFPAKPSNKIFLEYFMGAVEDAERAQA